MMRAGATRLKNKGMTLLEASVTMIVAVAMTGTVAYYYTGTIDAAKASSLQQTLSETRKAIDAFYKNTSRYPKLEELVPNYLRTPPIDPVAKTNLWIVIKEDGSTCLSDQVYTGAYDVKSTVEKYKNL